ncbi:hypothetical protein Fmac_017793 [Flemingia macrophylla]|uniref:Uncharacterized protein n=1 Tax=Flemingia macrophylla TaxID=520843 RepID=A0ABD1M3L9_9FABA
MEPMMLELRTSPPHPPPGPANHSESSCAAPAHTRILFRALAPNPKNLLHESSSPRPG